jgi:hypothetical protein
MFIAFAMSAGRYVASGFAATGIEWEQDRS